MTLYKFTGLCQEGAANVLPVALDHIMHPIIRDNHFATEIYHIDHNGHQQGVVLSEMSSFPYEEEKMLSLSLMQMLYPESSTYFRVAGGLPQAIETLTRKEVVDYHREFYSYNNATLLLIGAYDERPEEIFKVLGSLDADIRASRPSVKRPMAPPRTKRDKRRNDILFASEKSQTGSMGFAWEGPPVEDLETVVALEMLIDYMTEDTASPLRKRFTNRPVPIASDIKFELSILYPTMIELSFTEVPFASYISHAAAAAAAAAVPYRQRDAYASTSYPSPADAFGPLDLSKLHDDTKSLFASNYYRKQLVSTLTYIVDHWLSERWSYFHDQMTKRAAVLEAKFARMAMDDRYRYGLLQMLARDAMAYRFSPESAAQSQPNFASRGGTLSMRRQLLKHKDHTYWQSLVQKWFLDGQMVHVAMIPDPKLRIQIEAEQNLARRNRIESMSAEKLKALRKQVEEAVESIKVHIPPEVLSSSPPMPDISKLPVPKYLGHSFDLRDSAFKPSLFGVGRVLVNPGASDSILQISLPLVGLASDLRPYLPLFVRLLNSSTGLIMPRAVVEKAEGAAYLPALKNMGMPLMYMSSECFDEVLCKTFTENSAFIGEHLNRNCTGHWPVEVLTLFGSMQGVDLVKAFNLLIIKLLFGDFGTDATLKAAAKERNHLVKRRGTGSSLLIDTSQWIRIPGLLDATSIFNAADSKGSATSAARSVGPMDWSSNEPLGRTLNIYHQISFLSSVSKSLASAISGDDLAAVRTNRVGDALMQIRAHFARLIAGMGMIHVTQGNSVNSADAQMMIAGLVSDWHFCSAAWKDSHHTNISVPDSPPIEPAVHYRAASPHSTPPRKRRRGEPVTTMQSTVDMPLSVQTLSHRQGCKDYVSLSSPLGFHIPLSDLQTSYVGIQVPLSVQKHPADATKVSVEAQLEKLPALEFYALSLLTIILNRSEGLVKNAIRGRGYAYGVGMHPKYNDGHLAVFISHAVDPQKALEALWEVIEMLATEEGWATCINAFQLDTARSTYLFRTYNELPQQIASEDAYALFYGYTGIEQSLRWMHRHLDNITVADLRKAFLKFFGPVISKDKSSRSLYIIATPASYAEPARGFVEKLNRNPYGVSFKGVPFSDFNPIVSI
ncbi:hypothetical protein GGI07_000066 [Coemansia sp. Benny D115]|nr:hypothetical protein GGI07_000066 [Coemansia sp. Benny D115]